MVATSIYLSRNSMVKGRLGYSKSNTKASSKRTHKASAPSVSLNSGVLSAHTRNLFAHTEGSPVKCYNLVIAPRAIYAT
ncbi:Major outer membrane porin [Frankliniella fusca]|uniref:Major outer membrane porin n=1 Tax=Frankliniella fusca TaxID=407009 RepID=A0AAE1GYI5_9NEOP|nr:Major outer membrane porin [Frankliniella fusca]